jgi:DNA-binding transcriptional LysR family regulator
MVLCASPNYLKKHGRHLHPQEIAQHTVIALPKYRSVEFEIYAVYPSRQFVSAKVRLLIEFLVGSFKNADWYSK